MNKQITIVGLGPGDLAHISLGAWEALQNAERLVLRTAIHPTAALLAARGIRFTSFDDVYETAGTFAETYAEITRRLLDMAAEGPLTYAVPGHPLVGEDTVRQLLEQAQQRNIHISLVPSMSALDAIFTAARLDPLPGLQILDALQWESAMMKPDQPMLFLQLYNRLTASRLKLALLEVLPAETPVILVQAAGAGDAEKVVGMPLYEIDRSEEINHLTSLYIAPTPEAAAAAPVEHPLDPLVQVMRRLLDENGCPWDREQTHTSLQRYLIEEAYEVLEAIDNGDMAGLAEELGDVLLQVVFHAELARQAGNFDIDDVVAVITEKMIRRHPHVFADVVAEDAAAVLRNWEQIKKAEKSAVSVAGEQSLLAGVPRHLPALMQAEAVQKKAAKVGFEWAELPGAMGKVHEELEELEAACRMADESGISAELGDLLFALVNVSRYVHVDAESALRATTAKFRRRFRHIERQAAAAHRHLAEMSLAEMDALWDEAKSLEKKG